MKTKELIQHLQTLDPSGELDCVVGNEPISSVEWAPGYYDGMGQQVLRAENNPGLCVGAKFLRTGHKIQIHTWSIEEAVLDNPELPVDFSEVAEHSIVEIRAMVEVWRAQGRRIHAELEAEKEKGK